MPCHLVVPLPLNRTPGLSHGYTNLFIVLAVCPIHRIQHVDPDFARSILVADCFLELLLVLCQIQLTFPQLVLTWTRRPDPPSHSTSPGQRGRDDGQVCTVYCDLLYWMLDLNVLSSSLVNRCLSACSRTAASVCLDRSDVSWMVFFATDHWMEDASSSLHEFGLDCVRLALRRIQFCPQFVLSTTTITIRSFDPQLLDRHTMEAINVSCSFSSRRY